MILVSYIALGAIVLLIAIFIYNLILYPQIRLNLMKQKHGDKIKTFFHIGEGIFKEYYTNLTQKKDSVAFIRGIHQKNIKALAYNLGTRICLNFVDPELVKQVHQNPEAFRKNDASLAITFLFGNSILFAKGKSWQRQRQFLGKSFHFEEIKNYLPLIKEICDKVFERVSEKLTQNDQLEINAVKICEQVTSEVVFRAFFGSTTQNLVITRQDGSQIPIADELIQAIMNSFQLLKKDKIALFKYLIFGRNSTKFLRTQGEQSILNRLIAIKESCLQVVQQRKNQLQNDPTQAKKNFLDQYLYDMITNKQSEVNNEEIIDNFLGLFFAGTDTTGNMTGVALYYLSRYPDIQKQAREEVIQILSQNSNKRNHSELFSQLTFENLQNMNLINSILKESLRLIPPAIEVFPRVAIHNMKIGEFQIKKGDLVSTYFIYNQSNPELYQDPEIFNPQRWMNVKDSQNNFNFTPFSLGPRNCIGQHLAMIEGKCMLACILLNFDILPNYQQEVVKELRVIYGFQKDNLIYFKQRKQNN
ncbi:cytochrome P450 family monooxygenase (macronuclear) [Tetrahymena thermophila SB210]|uniref:Cytochrome P450 family monooxygenase n=2 Tax=Tetrahymena thermophila TaxID=5911 RepID=Q22NM9_TETTS|nr:cytochrome P450 family monooxygenase [Tetrahymena thermophila SB210]ABY59952.1 cytochrome P450 monooxygenase CYP5005A1 [Tetrahymena thermophila]EAR86756.2 cytochrome P450 family monooxygenase [Tetrahymena thermophila SB210]|eukprot:XP_001007001.2 cytochrome P450 family monooxygenase [Tetrahymena thermophila SB210]